MKIRIFAVSIVATLVAMVLAYAWGGAHAVYIMALLCLLEISLSFDNSVVNATILRNMSPVWQQRFLTWGILFAVFGMRVLFPLLIVSLAGQISLTKTLTIALNDPGLYSQLLASMHVPIAAFGGMFLMMVFLNFIFDPQREVHWLGQFEHQIGKLGNIHAIELIVAIGILLWVQVWGPGEHRATILISGLVGILTFAIIRGAIQLLTDAQQVGVKAAAQHGLINFMYLEVLDASFSLDGVIGAFAITEDVVIIMLGLGVGAFFVRSITIYLVKNKSLEKLAYLEHGAHYALAALAVMMLLKIRYHLPEFLVGSIGLVVIVLSLFSSYFFSPSRKGRC